MTAMVTWWRRKSGGGGAAVEDEQCKYVHGKRQHAASAQVPLHACMQGRSCTLPWHGAPPFATAVSPPPPLMKAQVAATGPTCPAASGASSPSRMLVSANTTCEHRHPRQHQEACDRGQGGRRSTRSKSSIPTPWRQSPSRTLVQVPKTLWCQCQPTRP